MNQIETYLQQKGIQYLSTPEGVAYVKEQQGTGGRPQVGDYVKVHYTGYLLDGQKFDSSVDRGEPFTFQIGKGQVIKGWDIGIALFAPGGERKLVSSPGTRIWCSRSGRRNPPQCRTDIRSRASGYPEQGDL